MGAKKAMAKPPIELPTLKERYFVQLQDLYKYSFKIDREKARHYGCGKAELPQSYSDQESDFCLYILGFSCGAL